MDLLEPSAGVFKLVGPVLIKQDLADAKGNVDKRLQYLNDEM
jgi:prefoldin beta subunit